ncbi:bifunctional 4-hydroxy-2-oxoglutarate aldolase/2-dehydro-3-deoxy-phosphogluconate aldolase [Loktanella salsilacus]|jgi:2-dehydro-3-deoxyphosphogluconate aldolase/(4S)-4-hydroxy-2-oxoglutarate aldolase|uniref:2-dehydro-3-deoxy-phosphogluconate aldolase n=2 Tax=Loktanella salsilacus TaxID=195913 RepID=A0A1I4EGD4_9RHOB|nr:bifunctional 4-hydroxy-2-oxoglutarate aldolase/2-dehydro-3-deoxy-phosphogluconate aldolase [Loktanella salsilacus]MBU0781293.1 bifunctional 4-hydroxy-2-oxoglutarate aldolase/2-dehydro-3-deoxy-phosphogluconate aldolase [Alphaproteobacteria bacterium]MBU1836538.1 bifunctional 4-hydroxy-2-oxoglutarate aldolase/2-dehydro-3-deoxy-phosphogluconate aldolase [Alphaproteobacteria bacterium]UTH43155.1 bifunctional 4-hydroxy-2-oxoglutarate aldolase/2-dehydro-3-deoxy-phosphogluconate aldolase [Loktanella|tara:strand:+ start:1316 stop:1957 length:642 start_codon:yes stop_codon:yes gene_type:complete
MTPEQASDLNRDLCLLAPVVPVLVLDDASLAADLARALVAGGLPALEVTLRTPAALDAIREMAAIPGGVVGAGTLLTPKDVENAKAAGAKFGVSPGATDLILDACEANDLPLLPGVATASEAMRLLERGYTVQKFFPAEANGGAAALKAIGAPIPQVKFCPTGGVTLKNAPDYLALSNTLCVGGSWVAPKDLMAAGDWAGIEALAREAAGLKR